MNKAMTGRLIVLMGCGLGVVFVAGCGVELLTTTAIQGKLQAENMQAAKRQVGQAGARMAKINIKRAIDTYQAETGVFPPSLEVLVPNYLPSMPKKADGSLYGYDPRTGLVSDGPVAGNGNVVTAEDRRNLALIRQAVTRYGQATGYYPASLQALVQYNYLQSVPKTSSGQDFFFNPQDGALRHPAEGAQRSSASPRRGTGPGGGVGLVGEAVTGIGMRNQLGNMNNAGTSSAGGYARRGVGNATNQHNQRQSQALKDLGL